ncbi:serine hydrolase domain-containing protein [Blastomonas fulva]|uniref:serine hydrolase domain-containing protein n=1 Tax=Blastomonas fulva TaxID=1550728 RepID=UPI003D289A48
MHFLVMATAALASSAAVPAPPGKAEADAALDRYLVGAMTTAAAGPGCVAGIASGGKLLAERASGLANLELNVPMRTDMAFDIGSTSKQFTALSAAILARRGQLDLDADIRTYIPDIHAFDPPIRVKHLIYHSSGLPDVYQPLEWLYGDSDGNRYPASVTLDMSRGIKQLKFAPGSQYEYSNLGYLLLGQIVEKVSGQTLRAFADANIFRPMGMTSTAFHDDARELVPNRASAYSLKADGKTWEWRHSDFDVMGDGGVYSTLGDLAKWYGVYSDPSRLEGGQALMDMVLTPGSYTEKGASYLGQPMNYGFAVQMLTHKGQKVIGHAGGWAGYATAPYYFPARDFAVIAICNVRKREVLDAVLDAGAALAKQP